jgi:hypothetical protein
MKRLFFYLVFLLLICSCQKEIVFIPNTGRKLVINGLITTDSLINVRISKSYYFKDPLMGSAIYSEFDSAEVRFYKNNIYLDSLHYSGHSNYSTDVYYNNNYWSNYVLPMSGNEYKIIVKKAGFTDATATTKIPRLVKIEKVDTSRISLPHSSGFIIDCSVVFTDPPGEKNYYLINIVSRHLPWRKEYLNFRCNDPIMEEELSSASNNWKYGYAFSDKLIDGKKYSLNVSFTGSSYFDSPYNPNPRTSYTYYFRLISITEEYFTYIKSLNLFNATYSNPLAEPVMVYSNVSGGYGIFAGGAVSTDSIILHD